MRGEESEARSQEPECSPLHISAARWQGTPFYPRSRLCQVGVDCCQLAAAVLEEAGLGRHDLPGEYTVDFGDHAARSPLLAWFRERSEWEPVSDAGDIEPGDVVLFRVGRVANHCGVALGERQFLHCLRGHGVMVSRLDDPTYARRFVCAFRAPGGGP
jgi:cell wall-associated NlpC family hydrolase